MASFSFSQTKIALTLGVVLGISVLAAGVIGLNPNKVTQTSLGYQQPPPMTSLLEECGNFFWFDEDLIHLTNSDVEKGPGVVVPVLPIDPDTEPLSEEAFRYYPVEEIKDKTLPTVDEILVTAIKHEGFVVWYIPSTKADVLEGLKLTADSLDENIMIVPWLGGHGGEHRTALPQARNFAFMSYNQITQSCNFAEPLSLKNFIEYSNDRAE